MTIVRLMLRRHRLLITSWLLLLVALTGATVSSYQSTYSTQEQRQIAIELAQHNAATTLLYGNPADPGTPASMFTWEIGAIATVLAAIMAVLVAISMTRATEDGGTLELIRSTGIDPRAPIRGALAVLVIVAATLTLGCAVAVGINVGHVDAVTWPGAIAFGSVVGLTFLMIGVLAVLIAQIAATAEGARGIGFAAVGVAFVVRALADTQQVGRLNWVTPLGLRANVRPFTENRWWMLAVYGVVVLALAWLATLLSDRREYRAGLIPRRDGCDARLAIHSSLGLSERLSRKSILSWMIAVATLGTLFSAVGSGVVQQSRTEELGGFLASQLGTGDPAAGYLAYSGTVIGMVVSSFAVLSVLRSRREEVDGLTDHMLAAGIRRWEPLAWQVVVTAAASLIILTATGALSAFIAPMVIDGTDVASRAFAYDLGQWPAAMAVAGWTALLAGRWPRATWLAWAPLVTGGTLALLGELLGIPQRARDLGVFQHVPDIASPAADARGLLVLLTVAGGTCLLGLIGITRRDITTG